MPAQTADSTVRSTSSGRILLVEEYDALAIAIKSALRKYAPNHEVAVAKDLADARAQLTDGFDLVVIDFDPVFPGLTNFLIEVRQQLPHGHGIILGTGMTSELASAMRNLSALQFLPKPYEITDFGATVQALLIRTVDDARPALGSLGAADLVLTQCTGARTISLNVSAGKKAGEIDIIDGEIAYAKVGTRKDAAALQEMFAWSDVAVEEAEPRRVRGRGMRDRWIDIFLAAAAETKPRPVSRPQPRAPEEIVETRPPEPPPAPAPPPPKTGKKIVVVDDTEMLLVFVEDALSLADPQLRITTAPNGVAGVKEIEAAQPDLVLLDYSLPDINGDEVCRRLLANKRTAQIPIVMMSGHVAQMKTTAETYDNVVASIAKPFMSDALVALVQKAFAENLRPQPKPKPKPKPSKARVEKPPVAAVVPKQPPPPIKVVSPKPEPCVEKPSVVVSTAEIEPPSEIVEAKPEPVAPPPPQVVRPILPPVPAAPLHPDVSLRSTARAAEIHQPHISTPAIGKTGNEVVLGLNLEVVAMRLTPSLRMGAIRARPSSLTVSLHASPATIPSEIAFELGRTEMDASHRLTILRLVPTRQQFERVATRTAVEVGALNVVAQDSRGQVQLTPSPNSTMTMHLLAHLDLASVELSSTFELAALVLRNRSQTVRVTLGSEQTGVFCEIAGIRLDQNGCISEMLLNPLK